MRRGFSGLNRIEKRRFWYAVFGRMDRNRCYWYLARRCISLPAAPLSVGKMIGQYMLCANIALGISNCLMWFIKSRPIACIVSAHTLISTQATELSLSQRRGERRCPLNQYLSEEQVTVHKDETGNVSGQEVDFITWLRSECQCTSCWHSCGPSILSGQINMALVERARAGVCIGKPNGLLGSAEGCLIHGIITVTSLFRHF